jgi:hypothetical protein
VALEEFLKKHGCFRKGGEILDMGSGIGAPIHYYYKKILNVDFWGLIIEKIPLSLEMKRQGKEEPQALV